MDNGLSSRALPSQLSKKATCGRKGVCVCEKHFRRAQPKCKKLSASPASKEGAQDNTPERGGGALAPLFSPAAAERSLQSSPFFTQPKDSFSRLPPACLFATEPRHAAESKAKSPRMFVFPNGGKHPSARPSVASRVGRTLPCGLRSRQGGVLAYARGALR